MNPPTRRMISAISMYHHFETKEDEFSSMRVTSGNLACSELKKTTNRGRTKTASTMTVTTDIAATTAG